MASPSDMISPPALFKDRKAGLVVFGILDILLGLLCALFVPLMLLSASMAPKPGGAQNMHALAPAMAVYAVLAVLLIWLGIGSIMARRWARALLLIFSWNWLVVGVFSIAVMTFILPQAVASAQPANPGQPGLPPAANVVVFVVAGAILSVIFIFLPLVWVLFYGSKHVKATCEANDPVTRWTDRCPLPVLAISLWLWISCVSMVAMPAFFNGVIPFFGNFLTGAAGSAVYLLAAVVIGYCAWASYRLNPLGWWITLIGIVLFAVSGFMTYSRHDINEFYQLLGYSPEIIAQVQKYRFYSGQAMAWWSVCGAAPAIGYLLFVRRYFPANSTTEDVAGR